MASFVMELAGGREMVNEQRAEELIQQIGAQKPTSICLSNKSFDNGAATKFAAYLSELENVTIADISDIIAGRPEDEALRTLNIICSSLKDFPLVEVNLSDNALGAKGVTECVDVLLGSALKRLYVCNNGLSAEAAELLAKILLRQTENATGTCPALQVLHFYNNMAGDGGAKALAEIVVACSSSLEDFRFSATRSTKAGCESIASALASVPNLQKLDLCDNNFNGKTGELLVEALRTKSMLREINLRDASLEGSISDGKMSIFEALVEATTAGSSIVRLDLSGNEIDAKGAAELARALKYMDKLEVLLVDDCELGSVGAKHIATAVKELTTLKSLSLCSCEITSKGGELVAKAVKMLPSFKTLYMDGNQFTEKAIERMQDMLSEAGITLAEMEDNDEEEDEDDDEDDDEDEDGSGDDEASDKTPPPPKPDIDELAAALEASKI
mmetsp:Transcript_8730/g.14531  ORF Transcript_8730/g.14531 Transcript_8730/m.14531 type:complete len:444 (+) Transcript_8730:31-1362(+)